MYSRHSGLLLLRLTGIVPIFLSSSTISFIKRLNNKALKGISLLDTNGSAEEFCQAIPKFNPTKLSYILFMTWYNLPPIPSLNSFNSKYSLETRSNVFLKQTKQQYNLRFWLVMYLLIDNFRMQIWSTIIQCFLYAPGRSLSLPSLSTLHKKVKDIKYP